MSTSVENALLKTPLFANHQARGAKIVDFAGWAMPLQFTKVLEEHHAVRKAAGLFDISHMGLVLVSGTELTSITQFLDALVPQDISKLIPGKALYTQFLNEQGGILDDIIIYRLPDGLSQTDWPGFISFLIIVNASNAKADIDWMNQHKTNSTIQIKPVSNQHCLFALQGPAFETVLKSFPDYQVDKLPKRFHVQANTLDNNPVLLARTGYTGEDGVEIIVPAQKAEALWNAILDKGQAAGCQPIGLAARDTLRLEAAYPLHGHDITPETTPLEAGLGWSLKLNKASDFIGKAALLTQQSQGYAKRFYCLKINKKTIAREHDKIVFDGKTVGEVSSGSISPLTNQAIAMGYITSPTELPIGQLLHVEVRNQPIEAEIVERPFYKRNA